MEWYLENDTFANPHFMYLMDNSNAPEVVKDAAGELYLDKISGEEVGMAPPNYILDLYLAERIDHWKRGFGVGVSGSPSWDGLDKFFISCLGPAKKVRRQDQRTHDAYKALDHDGVDMRAPEGTPILAAADGTVYRVDVNPSASNYGIHVRLLHQDGYKTIYGHFSRVADGIFLNKTVSAGDIIGYSGNTGNSFGAHLHLGLKREGFTFTDANGNVWPYNLFDPTPFLTKFCPACFPGAPPAPAGNARLGLHASADAGIASGEASMFATAKIEMVKILSNMPPEHCAALRDKTPGAPFVIRVYQDGWDRPGGISPSQFIDWNTTDVVRYMPLLDGRTVHIELHNEPNLVDEGLTHVWGNGREFSDWLMPVIADFRKTFPTKSLVFPGLSPGGDVAGIRYDSYRFVQEAAQAIALCNVLGVHVYWQKDLWPMNMALDQLDMYRRLFPDKPILITEASNNRASTSASVKGAEYIAFWRELQRRLEVLGVTYFVGSASNPSWGWSSGTGEVWLGSDVPVVVGNR